MTLFAVIKVFPVQMGKVVVCKFYLDRPGYIFVSFGSEFDDCAFVKVKTLTYSFDPAMEILYCSEATKKRV